MKKSDLLTGFLLLVIIFLSLALIDTRLNINNNHTTIEVANEKKKIVFAGDSITDRYDLNKFYIYEDKLIINSGISGYKTTNMISRFNNLIEQYNADKLFLMIGTNDLGTGVDKNVALDNIKTIITMTKKTNPNIKIYYETIYPINRSKRGKKEKRFNEDIQYINMKMEEYCKNNNITYIDVYSSLIDSNGNLNEEYTMDGLHLTDAGYDVVTKILKPYVEE